MIVEKISIPEGVQASIEGREIIVKSGDKENRRLIKAKHVDVRIEDGSIIVSTNSVKKVDAAILWTVAGHIKNLIKGVNEGITYKLKMVYSHFPVTVKVEGDTFSVENFLGEKTPRTIKLLPGVQVDIQGADITLTGINKETVGQTAAQIEQLCKVRKLDRRIFQDGLYIVEKDGRLLIK